MAGIVAVLGGHLESEAEATRKARFDRNAFHKALDAVLDRYVEPVDGSALLARGLKHMVAGLDSHSHFLTASERKALRAQAKDGMAGLSIHLHTAPGGEDRTLEVVGVLPGSAAEHAGLALGDQVLEIGGHDVARMLSQIEAEALLMGKVGDTVALRVQRKHAAHPEALTITLAEAPRELMASELIPAKTDTGDERIVGCIQLRVFRHGVGEAFKKELARLRRSAGATGLAGLIIDLRGNPGGEVDEALVVADVFVENGILTRTRGRGGRILREEIAHEAGTETELPIVVLQDRHTASAAELLTAALHDHGRAKSLGERSYGKGTVQEIMGMPDGSVLKLTIARYFSPKDGKIDGVGLVPDVELPASRRGQTVVEALALLQLSPR